MRCCLNAGAGWVDVSFSAPARPFQEKFAQRVVTDCATGRRADIGNYVLAARGGTIRPKKPGWYSILQL